MPTIEFSTPLVASSGALIQAGNIPSDYCMTHRFYGGVPTYMALGAAASTNANDRPFLDTPAANRSVGQIHLMKGAVPTDFSGLVDFSSRSADVLITFSTGTTNSGMGDFIVDPVSYSAQFTYSPNLYVSTANINAAASGTVTWFWFVSRQATGPSTFTNTLYHQIVGTVGGIGSGADLEIESTNVTAGQAYRIQGLKLTLPTTFTY